MRRRQNSQKERIDLLLGEYMLYKEDARILSLSFRTATSEQQMRDHGVSNSKPWSIFDYQAAGHPIPDGMRDRWASNRETRNIQHQEPNLDREKILAKINRYYGTLSRDMQQYIKLRYTLIQVGEKHKKRTFDEVIRIMQIPRATFYFKKRTWDWQISREFKRLGII